MNEDDRRIAQSVGITLEEASRNMREAHAKFSADLTPNIRQCMKELRDEDFGLTPAEHRKRIIQEALTDDEPLFRPK
jgi:hypothetical protein